MNKENKKQQMKIYTSILLFVLITFYLSLFTGVANAATQSLRVTPIINDLKLTPGKPTSFTITVENISPNPVGIHAELSGFDITGDTPLIEQKPSAMVPWTHLNKEDILLGGNEKKTITVTITPPSSAKQNGYYETIFLTPILHQQITASSPIILSRIGVLVLGTIGNLDDSDLAKKVSIQNFTPSQTIRNSFPDTISFAVANNYFTHFDAKPFITITPLFGTAQTTELIDKHVLPGGSRTWQYQPTPVAPNIFYQMHLAVSVGGGKQIFADTWFVVLPYKLLLIIIFAAILFIATFKRHHLKKFITVLLHG